MMLVTSNPVSPPIDLTLFDLSMVKPALQGSARQAIANRDSLDLLRTVDCHNYIKLLKLNLEAFTALGDDFHGKLLVDAWMMNKCNIGDPIFWEDAFEDAPDLRAYADPIPEGELILYRGVGHKDYGAACGYSWTSDIRIAKFFAYEYIKADKPEPAVYKTTLTEELHGYILFHTNHRKESEYVLNPCLWNEIEPELLQDRHVFPPVRRRITKWF
jgi:hypothetical protein